MAIGKGKVMPEGRDIRAGDIIWRKGEDRPKMTEVTSVVHNPPGCPGKAHVNGSQCWDHCTPIGIHR